LVPHHFRYQQEWLGGNREKNCREKADVTVVGAGIAALALLWNFRTGEFSTILLETTESPEGIRGVDVSA